MALVTESGAGLADAESYISIADIATYLTAYHSAADLAVWTGLASDTLREMHARKATQYLDTRYGGSWKGVRAVSTQALAWPRSDVEDFDGYVYDSDDLPVVLERACAEAAFRSANGDTLISDESAGDNVRSESASVGSLSTSTTYSGVKTTSKSYPLIDRMLAPLLSGTGSGFGMVALERA